MRPPEPLHQLPRRDEHLPDVDAARRSWRCSAAVMVLLPFNLPIINQLPFVRFLGDADWIRLTTQAVIFAIAALGLNLLTGVAGQVSLGHAFFMGVGAYAAVYLGGEPGSGTWGHGLPMWIWLPGAGISAALVGIIVAPAAVRVRGLYLGIVTVGLVFIGIHLSRVLPGDLRPARGRAQLPAARVQVVEGGGAGHLLRRRRPLAVVRHHRQPEDLPVLPGPARRRRARGQEPRSAPAPGGRCRRSATATSPPRSWACPRSSTS